MRHSSGKIREKKAAEILWAEASAAAGAGLLIQLLLKIHPH